MAKSRPWVKRHGWRRRAIEHLKEIGLVETTSLDGVKNAKMQEMLANHYGSDREALVALYPTHVTPIKKVSLAPDIEQLISNRRKASSSESHVSPVADKKPAKRNRLRYSTFYDSDAWKRLRYQALKMHGAICQCCGASRADGVQIHVDHIKPRSKYPHLELELSNLQILCEPCNIGKSAVDETDWRDQPKTRGSVIWN